MLWENIKLSFKNFTQNRMRTFLSILGIVIGVGSVITIMTLGESATVSVKNQIAKAGLKTITIFPGSKNRDIRRLFTLALGQKIKKNINGVAYVIPCHSGTYSLKNQKNTYKARVVAVTPEYARVFEYETEQGHFISDKENQQRKSVIVLGKTVAENLFPEGKAIGKYIRVYVYKGKSISFKVIGVMKNKSQTMGVNFDESVYIPYNTYTQKIKKIETVGFFVLGTKEGANVLEISEKLKTFLNKETKTQDSFRIFSPTTIANMFTTVTKTLNLFLSGVAAISLLVGGIGIMNIMLVSVLERRREIGIRKALGATPGTIMGQFLTEAVILTVIGGITGMLLGTTISFFATKSLGWLFKPGPQAYLLATAFSGGIGIFFGFYPAARASKLDPVVALTYE